MNLSSIKLLATASILVFGILGSASPVLFANKAPSRASKKHIDFVMKIMTSVATGVILSTGLMHMLADALDDLSDFSLKHSNPSNPYPFAIFFTLFGALLTYVMSTEMNHLAVRRIKAPVGESKDLADCRPDSEEEKRRCALIRLWVLEIAIAVHSVVIGLALGVSTNRSTVTTLTFALSIHQALEGLAVGSLVVESGVPASKALFFVATFATTTPLGVLLGLGMEGEVSKVLQGVLSAVGAGILIESGFVEMLPSVLPPAKAPEVLPAPPTEAEPLKVHTAVTPAKLPSVTSYGTLEDHFKEEEREDTGYLRAVCYAGVFLGAGAQAFMAIWA